MYDNSFVLNFNYSHKANEIQTDKNKNEIIKIPNKLSLVSSNNEKFEINSCDNLTKNEFDLDN